MSHFYLESQDGTQSYKADMFCNKKDLVNGQIYTLQELGFDDWLKTADKKPQNKLKAIVYG